MNCARFLTLHRREQIAANPHSPASIAKSVSIAAKTWSGPSAARVWFAFALVYVFWGSTYLGISIAVRSIPPAMLCATRFLISGPLMLAGCAVSGHPIRIRAGEAWRLAVIGILLLSGGNAMVAWSEQFTPSGVAALIVASVPLWVMVLERVMGHW